MQVYQIMSQPVDVMSPSTTSREAKTDRDENIGSLPVGENGQLIGMVTDRDIVARAVAYRSHPTARVAKASCAIALRRARYPLSAPLDHANCTSAHREMGDV